MGRSRYKIYEHFYPYFMSSSIVDEMPLFSDPELVKIVLDSLVFLQDEREITVFAYVIMINHFHIIAFGDELSEKMQLFKSYTAREIINSLKKRGFRRLLRRLAWAKLSHKIESQHQVWQEGLHPKQVISDAMMEQKIEYIHNNPVKGGYVDYPEDWRYSSARNYLGLESLIPVTLYSR